MNSTLIISLLSLLVNVYAPLFAQLRLTEAERREFEKRTLVKINEFQSSLSNIASRNVSAEVKNIEKQNALELFINKGRGVTMEVSYINSQTRQERRRRYPLITYLNRLANLPYARVEMKRAKSCHVSTFRQSGEDENGNPIYSATACYYQRFIGFNAEGQPVYGGPEGEVTFKCMEIQLRYSSDNDLPRWIILLSDIWVRGTRI